MNPLPMGKPIWYGREDAPNVYAEFFESFQWKEGTVLFAVSADSDFYLTVNGILACFGQYPDYPDRKFYQIFDITEYLIPGKNILTVTAYCQNAASSTYFPGKPYIMYSVLHSDSVLLYSGSETLCRRHPCFQSGPMEKITGQLGYSFHYDSCGKGDALVPAVVVPDVAERLLLQPVLPLRLHDPEAGKTVFVGSYRECSDRSRTAAQRMASAELISLCQSDHSLPGYVELRAEPETDGSVLILDLEKENVGFLYLDFEVEAPCEVLIGWGEHLADGRVRTEVGRRNFAAVYDASAGANRFLNPLRRLGLRYLQIHFASPFVIVRYAGIRPVDYPLAKPLFRMKEPLHQRICDTAERTLRLCMHYHYEDCPWREQALYAMDSRNQMLCGYFMFGETRFAAASLETLGHSLRKDRLLELCAPAKCPITIPCFSAVWILALLEYFEHSGDRETVLRLLPAAKTIASGFRDRIAENGLIAAYSGKEYWNFYEWQDGLCGSEPSSSEEERTYDAPLCAFVLLAFESLSSLCAVVADPETERWARAAEALRSSILQFFYDPHKQQFASYMRCGDGSKFHFSELTQALCLCAGVGTDDVQKNVRVHLCSGEGLLPITLSHSIFKFDALLQDSSRYGAYVREEIERIWGKMLLDGATTFWETEKGESDFDGAGSLCHGWSAVPIYLYGKYSDVLGLHLSRNTEVERNGGTSLYN